MPLEPIDDALPPLPPRWRSERGWWVLGALLLVLLVAALVRDPWASRGPDAAELTHLLQAASLGLDGDLVYGQEDAGRQRQWLPSSSDPGVTPSPLLLDDRGALRYAPPLPYALLLAPWARWAPLRGAPVVNAVLLALAAVVAATTMRRRLGASAPWWVAVLLLASLTPGYVFRAWPEIFLASATAIAFALAFGTERPSKAELSQIFDGGERESARRLVLRWAAVGLLLGLVVGCRSFALPLLLGAAVMVPAGRRRSGLLALLLAFFLAWGALQLAPGRSPEASSPADLSVFQEGPRATFSRLTVGAETHALGWNLLYLTVGRRSGLLPYFPALLLVVAASSLGRRRWALWVGVGAALLWLLWAHPFDFDGGPWSLGNRNFLPLYPALWFAAVKPLPRRWLALPVLLAVPFVLPLWVQGGQRSEVGEARWLEAPRLLRRLLPYETTLIPHRGEEEVAWGKLRLRTLSPSLWPARGAPGSLRWMGGRRAELLLASPQPVAGVRLRLGPDGPTRVAVSGAELTGTVLRPDGRVELLMALPSPHRVHPAAWDPAPQCFYELQLRLAEAPQRPLLLGLEVDAGAASGGSGAA